MALTEFFRIAVEGATVDGRTIDRNWIDEMAAGYNKATYTARINCEHIAGFSPEPPFNSYGSVEALRAVDVELTIDGKPKKLRALEAQLDANDQLLAINKQGQKLFTSCEIAPNFAGTGKAGLVGLAVTDNPASLGTEMLKFAATATVNPLAARKQAAENHFSEATEAPIKLAAPAADPVQSEATSAFAAMKDFFQGFGKKEEPAPAQQEPTPPPPPANDNFAAFAQQVGKMVEGVEKLSGAVDAVTTRLAAVEKAHDALKTELATTDANPQRRTLSTGGSGAVKTDC